jgi:two-component system cell cycle sensor histidine kinase/response regulator CckA
LTALGDDPSSEARITRLEEQLLRTQRMENVGLLAAGIAHDLNNILAPMMLIAPLLEDRVTDPRDKNLLAVLAQSAERGAALVSQILSFVHGVGEHSQLVQLRHLVREIASVVAETFPKNIRLELQIEEALWPVSGNASQFHQVLLNLCVNARDAMPYGGFLRLRAHNVVWDEAQAAAIEGARPGAFVRIEVEDTGTGIAPEILQRIWEPFFTTKESGKGTGLGLSTVRGIVDAHHGLLQLATDLGSGTRFRLFLPAVVGPPAARPVVPAHAHTGAGEVILIVEDEDQIRQLASTILTRAGYRVLGAADGAAAATLFAEQANEIDLVITDSNMPNLDGVGLIHCLRRIDPEVRVLKISGLPEPAGEDQDPASAVHCEFLAKPFKPELLLERVYALLQTSSGPGRA